MYLPEDNIERTFCIFAALLDWSILAVSREKRNFAFATICTC